MKIITILSEGFTYTKSNRQVVKASVEEVGLKLKGLLEEINKQKLVSHPYVFSRLQDILGHTQWSGALKAVNNCQTSVSLQKYIHNLFLKVYGLSESRMKIKTFGKYNFQME